jgi:hypothetical protein
VKRGERHFFPDEEPEEDFPWIDSSFYNGMCRYCGHEDHRDPKCPYKPLEG